MVNLNKTRNTSTLICFFCILACLLAFSGCQQALPSSSQAIQPVASIPPASSSAPAAPPSSSQPPPLPPLRREIDFAPLLEQNFETIGWVEVPGTVIDYPIAYTDDNTYYLNHNEKREYDTNGAIYVDATNSPLFTDPVTLVYGHFTAGETHFAQLHKYKDRAFFDANRSIYIYTTQQQLEYQVVASFTKDDQSILYNMDYTQPADMESFIIWLKNHNPKDDAQLALEDVTTSDTFVVLLTCTGAYEADPYRYVVVARLVSTRPVDTRLVDTPADTPSADASQASAA